MYRQRPKLIHCREEKKCNKDREQDSRYDHDRSTPPGSRLLPDSVLDHEHGIVVGRMHFGFYGQLVAGLTSVSQGRFEVFNVNRPGRMHRISADFQAGRVSVQQIDINAWGVMNVMHTFSGTRANDPNARRDWALTTIWVVAMDALAAGLVLMVLSSYGMWFQLRQKRRWGLVALTAGVISCGFFVAGLAWLS